MKLPDIKVLLEKLDCFSDPNFSFKVPHVFRQGKIIEIGQTLIKAATPWAVLGELCSILPNGPDAEVVAVTDQYALLSPFDEISGLSCEQFVQTSGGFHTIAVGNFLKGKVVDGLGRLSQAPHPSEITEWRTLQASAPDPLTRKLITEPLPLGVRAIDGLLTCGKGQRIGIFAAAGGGKSTLLSMVCDGTKADIVVFGLIGERGREVREFLELIMSPESRKKSIFVVATSERPALERLKAAFTATTIAEFFRDQGKEVLLLIDSLTRYARAAREVGLASGEPPVAGGFPPSVFANLPRLLERAGSNQQASITAIYTVLVEADNLNEPVSDEVRSILDGHIVLSRKLAESNHYPAIDVAASISRIMNQIASPNHLKFSAKFRRLLSLYKEIELLVRVGEYQEGHDLESDEALKRWPLIKRYLCQATGDSMEFEETIHFLEATVNGPC